jgi:hypothetical protein
MPPSLTYPGVISKNIIGRAARSFFDALKSVGSFLVGATRILFRSWMTEKAQTSEEIEPESGTWDNIERGILFPKMDLLAADQATLDAARRLFLPAVVLEKYLN